MVVALSVPLATAALAGDSLTDTTTTDTSTIDDTTDSTTDTTDTTTDTTDTTTETVEDTTSDPSPSPSELESTVEETASELESTVDDTTATITGEEPTEESSPSPSPTDPESDDPTEQPSDDTAGDTSHDDGTTDEPAAGTDQQDDSAATTDTTERSDRPATSDPADGLASYADSDPQRYFTAAGPGVGPAQASDVLGDRYGLTQQPQRGNPEGRTARDAHAPAFLLADPYGGGSAHHATGSRSTVDILRRLKAIGAGPAEIVGVLAPFPVIGPASYSDDWHAPRDGGARLHKGADIFAPRGTPVIAVASGTITRLSPSGGLGGRTVHLTTDDGTYFYYAHLDAFHVRLTEGQRVAAGSLLGFVGNTGNAITTPPHLHFEIHPDGGAAVPPLPQLDRWLADARARLADLEAQNAGQPHAGGEALTPLVAPPAWTEDETNWTQGEAAGAGLAATTPQETADPSTSYSATTVAATGQRPIDRGALWVLVVLVLAMVGLQRLLSRSVRQPEPVPADLDGLLDEELRRFLDDADRTRAERRDALAGVG